MSMPLPNQKIVVPLLWNDEVIAVLNIDSEHLNHFDKTDALYLGQIAKLL
jgi:GAF domain-containing protein